MLDIFLELSRRQVLRRNIEICLLLLSARAVQIQKKLNTLEDAIALEQEINANCRLYAFDTIFPGVEINIKASNLKNDSIHKSVFYYEENQEIKTGKT